MLRSLAIRTKLMLLYLVVIATALSLFSVFSYAALRYALLRMKTDTLHAREERLLSYLRQNEANDPQRSLESILKDYGTIAHEGNLIQFRDERGTMLYPSPGSAAANLLPSPAPCAGSSIRDAVVGGQPAAIYCDHLTLQGRPVVLYIGGSLEDLEHVLQLYLRSLFLLFPGVLLIAAVGGHFLSRRALLPVDRMTKAAVSMGIGNLSARLPLPAARDELFALATAWNQLLGRLQAAVSRLTDFSADASHDLRTSITVILATAQLSLRGHRDDEEYREDLQRIAQECQTATTLLDALLSLARNETFLHEVQFTQVNLTELVLSGCRRVEDLAESSGVMLDWRIPSEELWVPGDEVLLQRLLGILLDNAIKYTPEYGQILVEVTPSPQGLSMSVRDTGIGISEEARQRIFERFYQGNLRDRKHQAGNGLGLSIARWIAEAHRAELTVESEPLRGSHFQVRFAATDPARPMGVEPAVMHH
jgi:heavy metal sensor kinase